MTPTSAPAMQASVAHFDALVFDCDGVLVDSEEIAMEVSQRMLADLGWDVDLPTLLDLFTGSSSEYFVATVQEQIGRPLGPDWDAPYEGWLDDALRSRVQPIPGVADALGGIGLPFALASNSGHRRIRVSLEAAGLLSHFPRRSSAEDVAAGKPEPDVYLHAAASLRVAPERCIAIDDSRFGVEAARRAGMLVLAFVGEGDDSWVPADQRVVPLRGMDALPAVVERLVATGAV